MKTTSLQSKALLLVAAAMAVAIGVALLAVNRVYGSIQDLDRISREDTGTQQAILQATFAFKQQVDDWKNLLLRGQDADALEKHWSAFLKDEKDVEQAVREARTANPHEGVRAKLEQFLVLHKSGGQRYRQALAIFKSSKFDTSEGYNAVEGIDTTATALLVEAEKEAAAEGAKAINEAVKRAEFGYRLAIAGTIAAMLATLVVLWFFFRRAVLAPMGTAVRFAESIAQGDLTGHIEAKSDDEAGQLFKALSRMKDSLASVVTQVRVSADAVVTASSQVAAGTTDLSQRTEEQASSLEETAASMEELSSTVRQNADNARQADELARSASKRAEQGGAEVVHVVTTMGDISDSAKRISDIISVIDGIAFQTNILALNAAVEAARAGDQGRGFAVVAAEVRSLAQRSAQAAKEINALIGNSIAKVDAGTRLVEQAGDTIQALVIDVKRVSEFMKSIAEASAEQSRGVQQVNKTVTEMDRVVQQNASAVQESAAAAEGMRQQAESLVMAVSAFRISTAARAVQAPVRSAKDARHEPVLEFTPQATLPAKRRPAPAISASASEWEEF
jgi:methyl-accepting chemotaxis protein-1 (serine sensor receptor)